MILIFIGKEYCGKTAVMHHIRSSRIITYTAVPENDSRENTKYHRYVTEEQFAELTENGSILPLTKRVYTQRDGSDVSCSFGIKNVPLIGAESGREKNYAVKLDVESAKALIDLYGAEKCLVVEITAKDEIRKARAMNRYADAFSEERWAAFCEKEAACYDEEAVHALAALHYSNNDMQYDGKAPRDIGYFIRRHIKKLRGLA